MYITGGIVNKNNPLYIAASRDFNLALKKHPCIIVFCYSDQDVINALNYCIINNIPFRVRSGRHDYEASSSLNNGIIIDLSNMDYAIIDKKNTKAKLGGGISVFEMYTALAKEGYTIPAGTCPDVGLCALTTCGGVGFASRLLGLTCDNLLEAEIINFKGEKIITNNYENEDLLWALKGGLASNFGIVTSLTFAITKVSTVSTYIITWDPKYFVEILDLWQRITPHADPRLTTSVTYQKDPCGNVTLLSRGQFFGSISELKTLIAPLLKVAPTLTIDIQCLPYQQANIKWSEPCPCPQKFKGTGSFISKPLCKDILSILNYKLVTAPDNSRQFYEFIGLGGNVSRISPQETAFIHRKSLYLIEIESVWFSDLDKDKNINWTNSVKHILEPIDMGTYRGFTDFDLNHWQNQYYGVNYPRLQKIKRKYDPYNIFSFPQSIQPY